eukprot:c12798_g1_i1.p1 GENE.c12798_g1_i1~~c12798_g1_i1.p1  ORF type:complete len:549 (+),score=145.07 c12798_g1_i1:1-1647(+)
MGDQQTLMVQVLSCFVVCLLFATSQGLVVLSPPSLANRTFHSPVYGKFFGPQHNFTCVAQAKLFDGDICKPIAGNYSGSLLVTKYSKIGVCSFRHRYVNMLNTGAVAAITLTPFPESGQIYYVHDGDFGRHTKHLRLVWLEVYQQHFADVVSELNAKRESSSESDVWVQVTIDANKWAKLYHSWYYVLVFRVVLPTLLISTALFGYFLLKQITASKFSTLKRTQILVTAVESTIILVDGLFLATTGFQSDPIVPLSGTWFFATGGMGWSMFSTAVVGIFYYSFNRATTRLTRVDCIVSKYKYQLVVMAVVFVGLELSVGIAVATGRNPILEISICMVAFAVVLACCAIFFLSEKYRFRRLLKPHVQSAQSKASSIAISAHLDRWLRLSAIPMLLACIFTPLVAVPYATTIPGFCTLVSVLYTLRWGIAITHIQGLNFKASSSANQPQPRILLVQKTDDDMASNENNNSTSNEIEYSGDGHSNSDNHNQQLNISSASPSSSKHTNSRDLEKRTNNSNNKAPIKFVMGTVHVMEQHNSTPDSNRLTQTDL